MSVFVDHSVLKHRHSRLKDVGPDDHHREWGWADEQSGKHEVHIPYAYTKSWVEDQKVLAVQPGQWDSAVLNHPCALYLPVEKPSGYSDWLYYVGHNGSWANARIGLALSNDHENFVRQGSYGKILDPPTGYDRIFNPSVVYDIYESDPLKRWKMSCCTRKNADGIHYLQIYYASDGLVWTRWKEPTQPTAYNQLASIFRFGNAFFCAYMDTDQDFRLSVYDKTFDNIYNHGKILLKGSAGTWDSNKLDVMSLYWNLGIWYICYSAADANLYFKAGMATSYDCFNWSKYPLNPVIDGAELGQYTGVYSPTMIMVEKDFIIYISQRKTVGGALEIYKFDIV